MYLLNFAPGWDRRGIGRDDYISSYQSGLWHKGIDLGFKCAAGDLVFMTCHALQCPLCSLETGI